MPSLGDLVAPRRLGRDFRWLLASSWTSNPTPEMWRIPETKGMEPDQTETLFGPPKAAQPGTAQSSNAP
ncbi:hypothetical protein [Microbacterium luticocti]|uniref:hypothetical protein n=1 Tax=Microbacterium luticocti TaxID=451764 RepID=UPI00048E5F4E|nr:hypothetical protein [Microbacterium luticocti]